MTIFTVASPTNEDAIWATSVDGEALHATSNATNVAAIAAFQLNQSPGAHGNAIFAVSEGEGAAVAAFQTNDTAKGNAIYGETDGDGDAISGVQKKPNGVGAGIYGEHATGGNAGFFRGNVVVTGDISFPGQDCAEQFTIGADALVDPGTVMALAANGELIPTASAYERKVVGVISGAGAFRPGIMLGKQENEPANRQPIALVGKVYCKVDASYGSIETGDLLTSSDTPGHAMRVDDSQRAFGAVIGKAMSSLSSGVGLIPIVIALQ